MARFIIEVFVLLISAFVYYRSSVLYTFYANSPARLERVNALSGYEVRFRDVVRNCEDVYLNEEEGWALLSCDPGRDTWNTVMGHFVNPFAPAETGLYFYNYAETPDSPPEKVDLGLTGRQQRDFHPLGLDYHAPSKTLIVANHAWTHCKVEMYTFDPAERSGKLIRTLQGRNFTAPNSFAVLNEKEFFFTNDHYFLAREQPMLAKVEGYAAIPGGSVNHVQLKDDGEVEVKSLAWMSFANGVALLNETHLAAASTTQASVYLYKINRTEDAVSELLLAKTIPVPFLPDNLSVDGDGKILIAGHPHAPSIEKVSKMARSCKQGVDDDKEECAYERLSWVAEWSEQQGLKTLYAGSEFGSSTTAARDVKRKFGVVTGLYERGLLVWKA